MADGLTLPDLAGAYRERFAEVRASLPGADLTWLDSARAEALERFVAHGFPNPRVEAWKFTSLAPLQQLSFRGAGAPARRLTRESLQHHRVAPDGHLAVFVNGCFRPDLSDLERLPAGVQIRDLKEADEQDWKALIAPPPPDVEPRARALYDLNLAFMSGGAVIRFTAPVEDRLQLLFVSLPRVEPMLVHIRNLIRVEPGAAGRIVETYADVDDGKYWTNAVNRISVAAGASLHHCKLQAESGQAFHTAAAVVQLAPRANYVAAAVLRGAVLGRDEIEVALQDGASADLSGVILARGDQHLDVSTRLHHAEPRGTSLQEVRSVVDDRAHSVFQGSVRVAPGAQKTDARQLNKNLLLSPDAVADTKPELEILADDVKCSHGAAVGDLDQEALFYLRSRGIDAAEARALLIAAFIEHVIERVPDEAVRAYVRRNVADWHREATP
jgi:Fe-S cluster assembly protein SufD